MSVLWEHTVALRVTCSVVVLLVLTVQHERMIAVVTLLQCCYGHPKMLHKLQGCTQ